MEGKKPKKAKKYKTYKTYLELAEAYKSGELRKEEYILYIDNNECLLHWRGADEDEPENPAVFRGNVYKDIKILIESLGIPCSYV